MLYSLQDGYIVLLENRSKEKETGTTYILSHKDSITPATMSEGETTRGGERDSDL